MNASALLVRGVEADALRSGALLAVRVVAGLAMALHGAPKMLAPFSWMGPEAPVPGLLQAAAAAAEFFGGIAWAVGLATPLASAGIVATMITAVFLGHVAAGDPLVRITVTGDPAGPGAAWGGLPTWLARADGRGAPGSGSSELALLYAGIGVVLFAVGPGRFSLDAMLARRRARAAQAPDQRRRGRGRLPAPRRRSA